MTTCYNRPRNGYRSPNRRESPQFAEIHRPRTAAGKAASSQNATRHGLYAETLVIDDENAAGFESLQRAWFDDCQPQGQREIALVHELIRCDWLTRRTSALETQLWNLKIEDRREWLQDFNEDTPLAHAYPQMSTTLVLIQRRLTALSRSFHKALHDLERLQHARAKTPAPPDPAPEIGFVPNTAPTPESAGATEPPRTPSAAPRPQINALDGGLDQSGRLNPRRGGAVTPEWRAK